MNSKVATIDGDGVAAACSVHLLRRAGFEVVQNRTNRPKLPGIMIGEGTQRLMADVFDRQDLFAGFPRITTRIVAWGPDAEPQILPHSAVVLAEKDLLDRIGQSLLSSDRQRGGEAGWTISTGPPLPFASQEHHFGSRTAAATAVSLRSGAGPDTCWIESLQAGWLFLLPRHQCGGWLLSVGGSLDSLLSESRLISRQVDGVVSPKGTFACHPRITYPLCSPGYLACGSAAVSFDPLCGDGVGNAIREAILAAAVVDACHNGGDAAALASHYKARLLAGFSRHLKFCEEFYEGGHKGSWWDAQLAATRLGLQWCAGQIGTFHFQYQLNGFALERLPESI